MPDSSVAESYKNNLFELLDETFDQVQGRYMERGTTLFETLATISAEEASQPVSAQCASLAAQVAHVTFYLEVGEHYLLGKADREWDWREIWNTVEKVTPEEWEVSKNHLRETYRSIRSLIEGFAEWDNDHIGHTMNLLVHTAYHLGEIRQALCTLQNRG